MVFITKVYEFSLHNINGIRLTFQTFHAILTVHRYIHVLKGKIMTIIEGILFLTRENNISIYELCKRANISQSTLSNLVNRGNAPTLATLEKICSAFGIQLWEFFLLIEPLNELSDLQDLLYDYFTLAPKQKQFVRNLIHDFKKLHL